MANFGWPLAGLKRIYNILDGFLFSQLENYPLHMVVIITAIKIVFTIPYIND